MDVIQVLIVEDDPAFREGLAEFLSHYADIRVAAAVSSKKEALAAAETGMHVDVVLMDIHLSGASFDGIEAVIELNERAEYKCIMLTSLQEPEAVQEAICAGAVNYVPKFNLSDIPHAIREAHRNAPSMHHRAAHIIRNDYIRLKSKITDQEIKLLELVEQGHTVQRIAQDTYMEEQSVKNLLGRIAKKLKHHKFSKSIALRAKKMGWFR